MQMWRWMEGQSGRYANQSNSMNPNRGGRMSRHFGRRGWERRGVFSQAMSKAHWILVNWLSLSLMWVPIVNVKDALRWPDTIQKEKKQHNNNHTTSNGKGGRGYKNIDLRLINHSYMLLMVTLMMIVVRVWSRRQSCSQKKKQSVNKRWHGGRVIFQFVFVKSGVKRWLYLFKKNWTISFVGRRKNTLKNARKPKKNR